ncbi:transposase [Cucumis melo var. makuwa]|nr:transposase [Cucumis melo var. makuwa]
MCTSFGSTRLMCASFGSTRLICASFGSTRLICAFYGTTRLLCRVRARRGADRREAGRMREGHMDVSGFLFASADVFCTLLDIPEKTKDGSNARCDLADLKIPAELTSINGDKNNFIPPTCYTLTKKEKRFLLKTLSEMKVPWGYSSNVRNLVSMLPKHVRYAIARLCLFFNSICNKVIDVTQVEKLQEDIVIILCLLEKYFPPSFFTIMVHLTVHLVREVGMELATEDVEVSDNLRWISHGPHPVMTTYNSYAINGCHYHTKSHDKNKTVQNSGVSLVAKTVQVCSSKDKNPIIGEMSFYGVIEEICELNYNTFKVAIFKCDWVENNGCIKADELGFVLVYLSRVGYKNDSFILATQAKQVFFVEDPSDSQWSIVLTPPQRDFEDQYNDDELGDIVLNFQGMPKAALDIESRLDLDENTPTYVRADCEGTWTDNE